MHRLDGHINDLEPRIAAIYDNVPKQEEPSLQVSLCSYGWILLDSWVAWRTLRFILRDANISENVQNKWFQTPSSYTASQIKAIWGFSDKVETYLEKKTGKKLKDLFDRTIQAKRNSLAHFTEIPTIGGQDAQLIKRLFEELSIVFLLYENYQFFMRVQNVLKSKGYKEFYIEFSDLTRYKIEDFKNAIEKFSANKEYKIFCKNENDTEYVLSVSIDGCRAGKKQEDALLIPVFNDVQSSYSFLKNKGYYQNLTLFVSSVIECWNKSVEADT